MIFFKWLTVIWCSTTTEKLPPVVVVILRVICDTTISEDEPHPSVRSRESLPDGNFSILVFFYPFNRTLEKSFRPTNWKKKKSVAHTNALQRNDEGEFFFFFFFCKWFAVCHNGTHRRTQAKPKFLSATFSIELLRLSTLVYGHRHYNNEPMSCLNHNIFSLENIFTNYVGNNFRTTSTMEIKVRTFLTVLMKCWLVTEQNSHRIRMEWLRLNRIRWQVFAAKFRFVIDEQRER